MKIEAAVNVWRSEYPERNLEPAEQTAKPQRRLRIRVRPEFPIVSFIQISVMANVTFTVEVKRDKNHRPQNATDRETHLPRSAKSQMRRLVKTTRPAEQSVRCNGRPTEISGPAQIGPTARENNHRNRGRRTKDKPGYR